MFINTYLSLFLKIWNFWTRFEIISKFLHFDKFNNATSRDPFGRIRTISSVAVEIQRCRCIRRRRIKFVHLQRMACYVRLAIKYFKQINQKENKMCRCSSEIFARKSIIYDFCIYFFSQLIAKLLNLPSSENLQKDHPTLCGPHASHLWDNLSAFLVPFHCLHKKKKNFE